MPDKQLNRNLKLFSVQHFYLINLFWRISYHNINIEFFWFEENRKTFKTFMPTRSTRKISLRILNLAVVHRSEKSILLKNHSTLIKHLV